MAQDRQIGQPEDPSGTETEVIKGQTIVSGCIDFRTVEKARKLLTDMDLADGDYFLLATAGAALNPNTPNLIGEQVNTTSRVINLDHTDCGYAKKTGSDNPERHQAEMAAFGQTLKDQNPNLSYESSLIKMTTSDLRRHDCSAVAIIKGTPEVVRKARQKLHHAGRTNDHDEIARPINLSPDDQTIWDDFGISLALHDPRVLFIFDDNPENLDQMAQKAQEEMEKAGKKIYIRTVNTSATLDEDEEINLRDYDIRINSNRYDPDKGTFRGLSFEQLPQIFTYAAAMDYMNASRSPYYDWNERDLKPEAQELARRIKELEGIESISYGPRNISIRLTDTSYHDSLRQSIARLIIQNYGLLPHQEKYSPMPKRQAQ